MPLEQIKHLLIMPSVISVGTKLSQTAAQDIIKTDEPLTIKWQLGKAIENNIIWIKSIQQYNGWICGWMAMYNAIQIMRPIFLQGPFASIRTFIEAINQHENNNLDTRYASFVNFQKGNAEKIYNTRDLVTCGSNLSRNDQTQPINKEDKNIEKLDECLVKTTHNTWNLTLDEDQIKKLAYHTDPPIYVCFVQDNWDFFEATATMYLNEKNFTGFDIGPQLQKAPPCCSVILVLGSHITLLAKVTLSDKERFVVLMNSENLGDSSARSETRGKYINYLCNALLINK